MYAKFLYARFGFHLISIYIEEEVLSELGKVERSILQLSFHDDEGQHFLFPLGRYRSFGLNAALMAASTNFVLQPSDMSSIQPPLLYLMKLESPNNLMSLSSGSFEDVISNILLPTPTAHTPISDSKCSEYSKLSSLLLVHLVIPTSLALYSIPRLVSIPVSWTALDAWPHSLDIGMN